MKILSSEIHMDSKHLMTQRTEENESLKFWTIEPGSNNNVIKEIDTIEISEEARIAHQREMDLNKAEKKEAIKFEMSEQDKQKILLLEKFMEKLTGKKIKFQYIKKITFNHYQNAEITKDNKLSQQQGWGLEYNYSRYYNEQEKMSFRARGCIKTQDGQSIDISLQLNMSRHFASYSGVQIKAGDELIDPIVINLDGAGLSLTQKKYIFDLDTDGKEDQISFVNSGSGLLALDLNNDGIINNGGELFGPNTGDGFNELRVYDADQNGWIDENDPIFDQLKIWIKDENDEDRLLAIGKKGIGAIYLGNIETPFAMKDGKNNTLGQMKSSSFFLNENGQAGTVHQIDLAI
ncbi:MAG: hypothetical protein MJA31_02615 [Clostridia bacterium]|nr:hypothetical protein [Clostridia bacterium]